MSDTEENVPVPRRAHAQSVVASWLNLDGGDDSSDEAEQRRGDDRDAAAEEQLGAQLEEMAKRPARLGVGATAAAAAQAAAASAAAADTKLVHKLTGKRRRGEGESEEAIAAAEADRRRAAEAAAAEEQEVDSRTALLAKAKGAKAGVSYNELVAEPVAKEQALLDKKKAKMQRDRKRKKLKKKQKLLSAQGQPTGTTEQKEATQVSDEEDEASEDESENEQKELAAAPAAAIANESVGWMIDTTPASVPLTKQQKAAALKAKNKQNRKLGAQGSKVKEEQTNAHEPQASPAKRQKVESKGANESKAAEDSERMEDEPSAAAAGAGDGKPIKLRPNGRVRTKKRSKQKNIKKDMRPEHLKPPARLSTAPLAEEGGTAVAIRAAVSATGDGHLHAQPNLRPHVDSSPPPPASSTGSKVQFPKPRTAADHPQPTLEKLVAQEQHEAEVKPKLLQSGTTRRK